MVCMTDEGIVCWVLTDEGIVCGVLDRRRYRLWCIGQTKASSVELLFVSFDVFSSW